MAGFGNTFRKTLNDAIFRASAFTMPATIYVSLHTGTDPGPDGQAGNEVSGGSYARVAVTSNTTNWDAGTTADPSVIANATTITFPTATGSWGTVQSFGLWRHATDSAPADFIGGGALSAPQSISTTNTASFAVSAITHSFDSV